VSTAFGPAAVGAILFLMLVGWCFTHRRVDRSLAALGLYLGLLAGYLKLRTGSSAFTLLPAILVAAIAAGALIRALRSHSRLSIPPLGGLVIAFTLIVIVEMFNPHGRNIPGSVAGLAQDLEYMPLFFLGFAFIRRKTQVEKLLLILVVCASLGGLVSFYQSTLTPAQFASWGPGYSERVLGTGPYAGAARISYDNGVAYVRPFGLGSDIGDGGLIAALALPGLIALMLGRNKAIRVASVPLAVGIALAAATSGSRASLVVFVICALVFALLAATSRAGVRLIVGLTIAGVLVYGAFQFLGPGNNSATRAQSITPSHILSTFSQHSGGSLRIFGTYVLKYPLGLGTGSVGPAASTFSNVTSETNTLNTETEWNFLLLETGLAGLLVFVIMNLRLMWVSLTRIRRIADQQLRLHLAALAAPVFGLIAAGFASPTTATVPQAPYFWFVAGVLSYWLIAAMGGSQPNLDTASDVGDPTPLSAREHERTPISVGA